MSNPNAGTKMYYIRQSDGLAYCFSPVPLLAEQIDSVTKLKDGVQTKIGVTRSLTFRGTLLPDTPALSGVNPDSSCFELLDRKSDQLNAALSEDYGNLLIVDASGYPAYSLYPRVASISYDESQIVRRRDYQIVFEISEASEVDAKVSDFQENWSFNHENDDTIGVTHSISAVGLPDLPAGTGAINNAKYFVLQRANVLDKNQSSFLKSPFVPAAINVDNLFSFNHVRGETIDETAGSYEISESWVLASGNYKDDRTVETSYAIDEQGNLTPSVVINGTVQGYGDLTTDRFTNAINGFNNVVGPEIGFFSANGVSSKSRSDNRFAGNVSYSITFDDPSNIDGLEGRTIQRTLDRAEDGSVSQSVTTSARVRITSSSGIQPAIDYCFANNYPLDNYVEPFFTASLSGNVETVSSQRDDVAKSFSLTRVFRDQNTLNYREEYQISREQNVENAIVSISVNGSVYGLASETGTKSQVRFAYASGAFFGTIEPLIRTRASQLIPANSCLGTSPISQTLGINQFNGIITYTYTYDNRFLTTNPSILDETIDVDYQLAGDIIASIAIPGKTTGPILQDQETQTGLKKNLRIQYRMAPTGTMCGPVSNTNQALLESVALAESNILVNNNLLQNSRGEKPIASSVFKTADSYSFNRRTLLFSRNVTWEYTFN